MPGRVMRGFCVIAVALFRVMSYETRAVLAAVAMATEERSGFGFGSHVVSSVRPVVNIQITRRVTLEISQNITIEISSK